VVTGQATLNSFVIYMSRFRGLKMWLQLLALALARISGFSLGFWLKLTKLCVRSALGKRFACAQLKIPLELLKIQLEFPFRPRTHPMQKIIP